MNSTTSAIEMRGIEKSFGTNPVLKSVDFNVTVGEVHALAGENGAGKSTLMKILQGVYQKDAGEILVAGQTVEITDTFAARKAGIGMVFQEFSLIPTLTVAQNIFLTNEPTKYGIIDDAKAKAHALEIFKEMEVEVDPSRTVESMPTALWQLTEIAKALAQNAKVHKNRSNKISNEVVLDVKNLSSGPKLQDVSLQVRRGEILGLAGLMGSGRTELVNTLFGILKPTSGTITINGKAIDISSPKRAIENRIALIPEDRRAQGLVLDHPVTENLTLPLLDGLKSNGLLSKKKILAKSKEIINQFDIKLAYPGIRVSSLSGGNQQKVVIGKWLGTDPEILLMDEPTAGVDIGTKSEILDLVRKIADSGKSVILISSELPELLSVSDRILVLKDGHVSKSLNREEIPSEEFLQLAIQGAV